MGLRKYHVTANNNDDTKNWKTASSIFGTNNNDTWTVDARTQSISVNKTSNNQHRDTMAPPHKKRKQQNGPSPLERAYQGVSFSAPRPSTGRPDSPSFFFASSYTVSLSDDTNEEVVSNHTEQQEGNVSVREEKVNDTRLSTKTIPQVVHQHVNGLCIVTAGDIGSWLPKLYPDHEVESIQFVAEEAPACSGAEKRKRQAKMLRGGKVDHAVMPLTVIAKLVLKEKMFVKPKGSTGDDKGSVEIPIHAGAWGTIVELNHGLTPQVLMEDPLLDGHLAIIQPSGRFPPQSTSPQSDD
jgi:hypothetical protein